MPARSAVRLSRPRTPIRRCHTAVPVRTAGWRPVRTRFPRVWPVPAHASAPVRPRSPAASDAGGSGPPSAVGRPHGGIRSVVRPTGRPATNCSTARMPSARPAGRVLPQHAAGPGRRPGDLPPAPGLIRVPASAKHALSSGTCCHNTRPSNLVTSGATRRTFTPQATQFVTTLEGSAVAGQGAKPLACTTAQAKRSTTTRAAVRKTGLDQLGSWLLHIRVRFHAARGRRACSA